MSQPTDYMRRYQVEKDDSRIKDPVLEVTPSLPLFVEKMEAQVVEEPGKKEKKYAYLITFKAVVPEGSLFDVISNIGQHKVLAHISKVPPKEAEV